MFLSLRLPKLIQLQSGLRHSVHDRCIVNGLHSDAQLCGTQDKIMVGRGTGSSRQRSVHTDNQSGEIEELIRVAP
jgi:hypothetical protein